MPKEMERRTTYYLEKIALDELDGGRRVPLWQNHRGEMEHLSFEIGQDSGGSLDDNGETFGVDPEALDFFIEEEARAAVA